MAPSCPQSKREEATTVVDLESGNETTRTPSATSLAIEPENARTTPQQNSLQYVDNSPYQDTSRTRARWNKIEEKLPKPLVSWTRKTIAWIKGPQTPVPNRIRPRFENIQTFPTRMRSRLPKLIRIALFVCAFMLWLVIFGVLISKHGLQSDVGGFGAPVKLACTTKLWSGAQECGLDGRDCLPFDNRAFSFDCPANCAGTEVLNPYTIGAEQIIYQPLVVGGTPSATAVSSALYRGDSFICSAAIHAGVLSNTHGGCGVLALLGEQSSYGSIARNGIQSTGFNSSFPMSFDFLQVDSKCEDPRWELLTLSTIFTAVFGIFTTSPATFFVPIFIIVYFQIAMASDPPYSADYASLAESQLAKFLPAAFVGVVIYLFVVRKTLRGLKAQLEKTIYWVGACWVGAMSNVTLELIPLQRLTSHDIHQQPGAITALVILVLVIAVGVLYQAWCFRKEGRLPRYLALYATLGVCLCIFLVIPGLELRIHHYILALLLLPGTSLQTRVSLLVQGLLVGLFINGVARWGFASFLQTAASLQGDALLGTSVPNITEPIISACNNVVGQKRWSPSVTTCINSTNITFGWNTTQISPYDGVSVLVNDVERFRGFHKDGDNSFTWTRTDSEHPDYFRFGYIAYIVFGGVSYSDFTVAGTWWPNGTWSGIPDGSS